MSCIGLNILFLIPGEVGGTENYSRLLINELGKQDQQNSYVLFCNQENFASFDLPNKQWRKVLCDFPASNRPLRLLYEQLILPIQLSKNHCDVVHSLGYVGPWIAFCKKIVTIHDANWLDCPEDVSFLSMAIQTVLTSVCIVTSFAVVTDSAFSKERLTFHFPNFAKKIVASAPWVSPLLVNLLHKKISKPMNKKPYVLCVGAFYPHKNTLYLLDLFTKWSEGRYELVLIGKNGADQEKVLEFVKQHPEIQQFAKVSLEDLANYYQQAQFVVLPSTYEGFGYPAYEAFSAGCTIVLGKKSLYDQDIAQFALELSFDPQKDMALFDAAAKKERVVGRILNPPSVSELLKLYSAKNT